MVRLPNSVVSITSFPAPQSLQIQVGDPKLRSLKIELTATRSPLHVVRVIHGAYEQGRNIQYWKPSERKTGDLWTDRFTDPKTKQQRKYSVYGGKLAGLLTQSLCREMFFESLVSLQRIVDEIKNLQIIGQFHDEIVMEWTPESAFESGLTYTLGDSMTLLERKMTHTALIGFPLAAEIKTAYRYIK